MKKMLLIFLLIFAVAVLAMAAYMGAFSSVIVDEQDLGRFTFVYPEMTGTKMKQVGDITDSISAILGDNDIPQRHPAG